jgi:hypothetical protein
MVNRTWRVDEDDAGIRSSFEKLPSYFKGDDTAERPAW